ncbi:hypothetical protein A3742_15260 [Oleiphilus sp. HI0071]|nr:hypothetical protein A3737_01880 [Oleiphilus sp. HI0065]KZY78427.1 hypothetical protein A3742_15260 [Oleiphilus sp. HI0071]KZZ01404.1 hypothetical protein A3744_11465 [Oleiphilus sp. HI0073]KZZ14924.1 hypothetical protein A3750_01545 [Oleiphilus sp. HI0079]KZZ15549.1 hypothetical protein A3751_03225 [Oleiphilus sp. HI0080]KZZ51682.1 hypothetical protein A3760_12470 [Oleiphilus sp. HI0122]KZZ54853.1 hypothetical protein A3758_00965 [Oleiphilus sp. HI0118]KZZ67666.1 hypothetical protein A37
MVFLYEGKAMIKLVSISDLADWREVDRVQRLAYSSDLVEDIEVLKEKADILGHFCFLIQDELTHHVLGYVLAHPYSRTQIPPLNSKKLSSINSEETNVFLHDMALNPSCSGRGLGKLTVERLLSEVKSKGAKSMTLVAVQASSSFWSKVAGFEVVNSADEASLAKYGNGAKMMRVEL